MGSPSSGEWLERALAQADSGVELDADLISGLVSFCELAPPPDAADYLRNIIGPEAGKHIIQEYLQRRGSVDSSTIIQDGQSTSFRAYTKPHAEESATSATKKAQRLSAESSYSSSGNIKVTTKKKKAGKAISLAEAAKGSVIFRQGQPCSCQARQHKLVSNCLSCGKIVCEQEGEGPCSFCGALVLREGSTYAGLDDLPGPLTDSEAAAEAYAKRLVDYDRNSAARTTVIDDQSDYYEFEGNAWLSEEEKALLRKKQKEIAEADEARRKKVVVTFDLVGRKVILDKDDESDAEPESRILGPPNEREQNRIQPNPTVRMQPVFVSTGHTKGPAKAKHNLRMSKGICLENSGRVQHDTSELRQFAGNGLSRANSYAGEPEASLDYN